MKKIAILGSTGSIGTQTLEVVRNNPELQVVALAAGKSVEQMEQQIREFHPLIAGMWSEEAAADLRSRVADLPVNRENSADCIRWTLPRKDERTAAEYSGRGCFKTSKLVHGTEDYDRFIHPGE